MSEKLKNFLIPCMVFLVFFAVYFFVSSYYQGGYTIGYSDYPMLAYRFMAGDARFGPAIEQFARESLGGRTSDHYIGHQLYITLSMLAYSLVKPFFLSGGYRIAGAILSSLLAAGGLVLFYWILKRAGMCLADRLFGVMFLGFSWYYSQNAHNNDACLHAALSVMIVIGSYIGLLGSRSAVLRLIVFWLLFSVASLLYMNTIPLVAVLFICFALRYPSLKDIAAFLLTGFFVGFGSLYGLSRLHLALLSYLGIHVVSTDLFELFAYYGMWMKATIFTITDPLYTVPIALCQRMGELFLPPHYDILAFLAGMVLLYFIGFISLFLLVRKKGNWIYWLFVGCVAGYTIYFIATRYIFSSRIFMACVVPVSYLVTDGFSRIRKGELPRWINPPVLKTICVAVVCMFIAIYAMYAAKPQLKYGETFYTIPSRDKTMLQRGFFEWVEKNTEPDSFIAYDSGYIDRVLGSMLMLYSSRLSLVNYTPNVALLGGMRGSNAVSGIRPDVPLAEIIATKGKTSLYLLATFPEVSRIVVPGNETLKEYYLFTKKGSFGKWGLFKLDDMTPLSVFVINDAIKLRMERCARIAEGKKYAKRELHWERLLITGLPGTTLVLVPTAKDVDIDTKERYLCYW